MNFKKYIHSVIFILFFQAIGIGYSYIFVDRTITYSFPHFRMSNTEMLQQFIHIFANNVLVFLLSFFVIRVILFIKNKFKNAKYTKVDQIAYYVVNGALLLKASFLTGVLIAEVSLNTNVSMWHLYISGILPHGILEMIPFIISFQLNNDIIKHKNWNNPFNFKKYILIILLLLITIAAIIESFITPLLLYS